MIFTVTFTVAPLTSYTYVYIHVSHVYKLACTLHRTINLLPLSALSSHIRHTRPSDVLAEGNAAAALRLAQLQPGESVLDLGAGSDRLIAEAKQAVGAGFCVAVDAVQGFLNTDIPWELNNKGLTVYPTGTPSQQVHLLRNNITNGGLANLVRALPGAPQTFDCIIVLHVMNTLPPSPPNPYEPATLTRTQF
jgi:SAM-dependent methyltransferase